MEHNYKEMFGAALEDSYWELLDYIEVALGKKGLGPEEHFNGREINALPEEARIRVWTRLGNFYKIWSEHKKYIKEAYPTINKLLELTKEVDSVLSTDCNCGRCDHLNPTEKDKV